MSRYQSTYFQLFRKQAEDDFREFYNKNLESRKTQRHERERESTNLCIQKDERKRDKIEQIKSSILTSLGDRNPTLIDDSPKVDQMKEVEEVKEEKEIEEKSEIVEINKHRRDKAVRKIQNNYSIDLAKRIAVENENVKRNESRPPRTFTKINVQFTPREFRNPARESKKLEEEQWLKKQAKAKDRQKQIQEDLQMDHDEILEKCSHFFKLGDFQSAEEILSHGVELFPKSCQLVTNRVAVRLKSGKYLEALLDSERALDLLTPEVEDNKRSRAAVRCRRAFALQCLEREVEALVELEEAARLLPEDEKIQRDLDNLRNSINS